MPGQDTTCGATWLDVSNVHSSILTYATFFTESNLCRPYSEYSVNTHFCLPSKAHSLRFRYCFSPTNSSLETSPKLLFLFHRFTYLYIPPENKSSIIYRTIEISDFYHLCVQTCGYYESSFLAGPADPVEYGFPLSPERKNIAFTEFLIRFLAYRIVQCDEAFINH